jgi:2-deoxy-D-gluconate 3-dehydrogenase
MFLPSCMQINQKRENFGGYEMTTQSIAQIFDLKGKVVIVTGGAMGIGQAIALRLAEAGASVMIADIDLEAALKVVDHIKSARGRAEVIYANASSADDAQKVARNTVEAFGRLDILVNNAGVFPFSPALQTSEELWDKVLGINLKGVFFYAQAAAQHMIRAGHGGKIVNVASIDSLHPTGNLAHYDASKGGVLMLTRALALEFGPHNITVNAIAPGGIQTPGAQATTATMLQATALPAEELMKGFMARIPLRRMGEPDDIAKVALFLASGASDYMTGSLVVVDGGYLLS